MNIERLELFPTTVWVIDCPETLADIWEKPLMDAIESKLLPAQLPEHHQTDSTLHLVPEIKKFIDWIEITVKSQVESLGWRVDALKISGMWATRLSYGATHPMHNHPNSWMSGVYYPTDYPGHDGDLMFYDPRPAASMFSPNKMPGASNKFISNTASVRPVKGRLVLFPSYLWHGVHTIKSNSRWSMSFDSNPVGLLGPSGASNKISL